MGSGRAGAQILRVRTVLTPEQSPGERPVRFPYLPPRPALRWPESPGCWLQPLCERLRHVVLRSKIFGRSNLVRCGQIGPRGCGPAWPGFEQASLGGRTMSESSAPPRPPTAMVGVFARSTRFNTSARSCESSTTMTRIGNFCAANDQKGGRDGMLSKASLALRKVYW